MSNYYAVLSRMKSIYRWGLMRNVRQESLSEHSLEVALVAHALALIGNKKFGKNYDCEHIAVCAMLHDTSEIITGDMPTPIKYYNDEIKTAYKKIEAVASNELIHLLPDYLQDDFLPLYNMTDEEEKIVKAADKLSALIKCIEEINMGNREFISAKESIQRAICNLNSPEADVFLKDFIPPFECTLDQQTKI